MIYLSDKRRSSALIVAVAMTFFWIMAPIMETYRCMCASGGLHEYRDIPEIAISTLLIPACCCTGQCGPELSGNSLYSDALKRHASHTTHPICCCASGRRPGPAVIQAFLKQDRRPAFLEFHFQEVIRSACSPKADHIALGSNRSFDRNRTLIPPHLSSTILLI